MAGADGEKKSIDAKEVASHNTAKSCWVTIHNIVYDVTDFLEEHPGGASVILRYAGTDATAEYDPIHPPGTLEENLAPSQILGPLDASTVPTQPTASAAAAAAPGPAQSTTTSVPAAQQSSAPSLPPLSAQLSLADFEATASRVLSPKAWAYYHSASDDQLTKEANNTAFRHVLLRPRVMVDVEHVDTSTALLGATVSLPVFVAPAAMARLAHPAGEAGIAEACARHGVVQCVSNNASLRPEQIAGAAAATWESLQNTGSGAGTGTGEKPPLWFQLYVQRDRTKSEAMLQRVSAPNSGYTAVVITLDAPTPGKREADERVKNQDALRSGASGETLPGAASSGGGLGKALFAGTSPRVTWDLLAWVRAHTHLPLVLKGIQTHEDAALACRPAVLALGVRGIVLSNHGGRALDTAPPPLLTLLEIRRYAPHVLARLQVFVDGGVRRGTDVVKALALGAAAVGLGRAALYALAGYGPDGVGRVVAILRDEVETAMRLLGVHTVDELRRRGPELVNVSVLEREMWRPWEDERENGENGNGGKGEGLGLWKAKL